MTSFMKPRGLVDYPELGVEAVRPSLQTGISNKEQCEFVPHVASVTDLMLIS